MTDGLISMPCLGRLFRLGMLYDCRSEKLIPGKTLWDADMLHKARIEYPQPGSNFEVIAEDSIDQKASHLEVDASLKLSLMGGLVNVSGAANYMRDRKSSKKVARVSLQYKSTSKSEQLGMDRLGKIQHPQVLELNNATHVVTGVLYGAEAFFVFDRSVSKEESFQEVRGKMEVLIKDLPRIAQIGGTAGVTSQGTDKTETNRFQCKFYGDFPLQENPSTFQDAVRIYQQLPKLLGGKDGPNIVPKKVWLSPLDKFDSRSQRHILREITFERVIEVQRLLEEIHELEMQSNDIGAGVVYQHFKGLREQMFKFKNKLSGHRSNLVKKLSLLLPKIRGGGEQEVKLAELLAENEVSPFAPQQLSKWLEGKEQEEKLLRTCLDRLEKSHFEFVPEDGLGDLQFDAEKVVCFAFKVGGEDDPYLEAMANYVQTGNQLAPVSESEPWYKDSEVTKAIRGQVKSFEEFAKTNEGQQGLKFVVTNIRLEGTTDKNGASIMLYNNGSPTEIEPPSQPGTPSVTKVHHNTVSLEWSKPACGSDSVTSYTILYRSTNVPKDQWRTCNTKGPVTSLTVDELTPGSTYDFKIKAECEAGFSPVSGICESVTTKLKPPQITETTHDSVTIAWSEPAHAGTTKSITSYTIFYSRTTDPQGQWVDEETDGPGLSTTVKGLPPQTTYYFKVRAECKDGYSLELESDISEPVTTKSELPSQPGTPHVTNTTHNSITIEWSKPDHGTGNITRYTVYYRCTTSRRGQWTGRTTAGPQPSLTMPGLTPQTKYEFKVRAESEVGCSNESHVSDPVTTRRKSERPSQPGTPFATDKVFHDNVTITWSKPERGADNIMSYTVFYRSTTDKGDKWMTHKTGNALTSATVISLKPATTYCFKVKAECDSEFSLVSHTSKTVKTQPSPDSRVALTVKKSKKYSRCISTATEPHIYELVTRDVMRDKEKMIAKCLLGSPDTCAPVPERVLMVVGATGAGKTTLINGIANYILGVNWDDKFRFKLITDEGKKSQAESQTSWITAYTFHLTDSSRVPFTLTVIDTPGFGDCEGVERDRRIAEQIKHFFSNHDQNGIDQVHGVGFVTQASMARLTPTQRYIFDSILSIYGKDIADNIFMMVTFCDGSRPPVLDAIKEANIPHQKHFKFNNSALYAKLASGGFDEMFWKLGVQSFGDFFGVFGKAEARSLTLTREVLSEREQLENVVQALHPQIRAGLSKIEQLRQQTEIVKQNTALIEQNKGFSYTITVAKSRHRNTEPGQHVTNCLECNYTCHERCKFANNEDKKGCGAMKHGSCIICPGKCHWTRHVNQPFWFELYEEPETRTSEDLKRRYDTATQGKSKAEAMSASMREEVNRVEENVLQMVSQVRKSLNRLGQIALKPNPLTVMQYIDVLIEGETKDARPGWMIRVRAYEKVKERAKLVATVQSKQLKKGSVFSSLAGDGACSAELEY